MATFVLGGARSGKSDYAQQLAEQSAETRIYIATAEALDDEMAVRIAKHKSSRGEGWQTIEAPLELVSALQELVHFEGAILVDCLTLWLSNLMHHGHDVPSETNKLIALFDQIEGNLVLVSSEVGLGLVPETPLGRAFRDAQGQLNRQIAAATDRVEFVAAGLPITLKGA